MTSAKQSDGNENDGLPEVTAEEFYQACGGKWTDDLRHRFCGQLVVPGSFVNQKLAKFERIAEAPIAIDWKQVEDKDGDGKHDPE